MRIPSLCRFRPMPARSDASANVRRSLARAAAGAIEGLESRVLFHFTVAHPVADVNVAPGTPSSTVDLTGVVDSDQITGTVVRLGTTNGNIDLMLYDAVNPDTVQNVLAYLNRRDSNQHLIHHRPTQ